MTTLRIPAAQAVRLAKGTRRAPGQMNRVETAYAGELAMRQKIGEVAWFKFEGITLKLAPDTRYTPDFLVMLEDGTLECLDTKGTKNGPLGDSKPWIEEDALVKIKCAAELFPIFRFAVMWLDKARGWMRREF